MSERLLSFTHHVAAEDEGRRLQTDASFRCSGTGSVFDCRSPSDRSVVVVGGLVGQKVTSGYQFEILSNCTLLKMPFNSFGKDIKIKCGGQKCSI